MKRFFFHGLIPIQRNSGRFRIGICLGIVTASGEKDMYNSGRIKGLIIAFLIALTGCRGNMSEVAESGDPMPKPTSYYEIHWNDNQTCDYRIYDRSGSVILADNEYPREPHIEAVKESVIRVWAQAGTGLSTRWTRYCDIVNGKVSDAFLYVLCDDGEKAVFVNDKDGQYFVVVQDIFDRRKYSQEIRLDTGELPTTVDPVLKAEFSLEGKRLTVTYLRGPDPRETVTSYEL